MTEPNPPHNPPLDPVIIDSAPTEPDDQNFTKAESQTYLELIGQLGEENDALTAELARLKAKKTVDDVRADLMEPYANNVFYFLVWYCLAVLSLILLAGFQNKTGFMISDTVLAIVAGSTTVSAIGLVGFVVSGLFGSRQKDN